MTTWSAFERTVTQAGPVGGLVAGVEPAEQGAVGEELLAGGRAAARDLGAERGDARAVLRRAEREHPAGLRVAAVVAHPEADDDPAGRVADDVDRGGAAGPQHVVGHVGQVVGLLVEVAGAVTDQADDGHVPALAPQHGGQRVERRRTPAVPGDEQHRPRLVLRHGTAAGHRPDDRRRDEREDEDPDDHHDAEHEPATLR